MRVLVTRDSARAIKDCLQAALAADASELMLDFSGIEAITPSFVDELMVVLGEIATPERRNVRVFFVNPPTRLSGKFLAIGRRHGLHLSESGPNAWVLAADSDASNASRA
ncbi:MAG: DUF4325 domain-containing protein [Deltaproteobacteria bacterium]|nr:DUF4325 domain-containing protein [Deltaproteobacteria bacterium]